jgi:hypothetical protein
MIDRELLEALIDELLTDSRREREKGNNSKAHGIDHAVSEIAKLLDK